LLFLEGVQGRARSLKLLKHPFLLSKHSIFC
jgi:hypothetical protein